MERIATKNSSDSQEAKPAGVATGPQREADPVQLTSLAVKRGRLVCELVIPDVGKRYSTPSLAAFVERQHPDIARHACVNGLGRTFGSVMETTSIAHLLEHIAIDLQVREAEAPDARFVGTTEWIDEAAGKARIELSFNDDLAALRAFNKALQFLNIAVIHYLP